MPVNSEIKALLALFYEADLPLLYDLSPQQAREFSQQLSELREYPQLITSVKSNDLSLMVNDRRVLIRHYQPQGKAKAVLVYFYGGGYVIGSVAQRHEVCQQIAESLQVEVFAVDYHLAPENPFPSQMQEGYASLEWVDQHYRQQRPLIVAGDSAGGHLAAMLTLLARDRKGPNIDFQLLYYPWLDNNLARASYEKYGYGFGLDTKAVVYFTDHYLAQGLQADYPAFPMHFDDFTQLPPAYIVTASNDVLIDEINDYITILNKHDGEVIHRNFDDMIHGFIHLYNLNSCYQAFLATLREVKPLIDGLSP